MLTRHVISFVSNLLRASPRGPWKLDACQFHATNSIRGKEKSSRRFSKKKQPDGPKIVRPYDCSDSPKPILDPACKVAVVVGGSDGFGFAAADHLLQKGARSIVIADHDPDRGKTASRMLCDSYGKDRVQFLECNVNILCQLEATLNQALCKHKQIHILFNDLDKVQSPAKCNSSEKKENYISKTIRVGLKILGKNHGGPGGVIVNCASILGFIGWPEDPFPIYCKHEPAIEVTMDFAKEFNIEETGVRMVALCPTNKRFRDIGLPCLPDPIPKNRVEETPPCIPTSIGHIGSALSHVIAWGKNGSAWLVEPADSVHEIPRLIHFPSKKGEKVDPKVYEEQVCSVKIEPPCVDASKVDASKTCPPTKVKNCESNRAKKK